MFFLFRKYEVLLLFTPFVLVLERALVLVVEVNWCGSFGRKVVVDSDGGLVQ